MSKDPYQYFRTEARELVDALTHGALDLEKGQGGAELVSRLLRAAHTLKGAARIVKLTKVSELSHAIEEVLAPGRDDPSRLSAADAAKVLPLLDSITAELAVLDAPAKTAGGEERSQGVYVEMAAMDAMLGHLGQLRMHLSSLERQAANVLASAGKPDVSVGALRGACDALAAATDHSQRQLDQLHEQAGEMRLVSVHGLFASLELVARDAADALGKRVEFCPTGGQTRLDAHSLRLLGVALAHLVRNAVAHGIESPARRAEIGKAATGVVRLDVQRRGDRAVFTCADDGAGLDLDRVREALVKRGLLVPADAGELLAEEALDMLLSGGISTTPRVTEISGRGLGLDVVRDTVAALKGYVAARTQQGRGLEIEISVPVSIESLEVLTAQVGATFISFPLRSVRRAVRLGEGDIVRSAEGESIICDGRTIPFLPLARILGLPVAGRQNSLSAVVLEDSSGTAVVGVDHLLGRQRVVLHALPEILGSLPAVAGAFFDGEGDPRLVLEPAGLIARIRAGQAADVAPAVKPPLLVIDDSLTTRMLEHGILETAGYEVETASSGEDALRKAAHRRYGVFIVDVEMPGMNGFEFIEAAQRDSRLAQVPAIVVTSRDSQDDIARGRRVGAVAYIVKSRFDEGLLLRTIRELVG